MRCANLADDLDLPDPTVLELAVQIHVLRLGPAPYRVNYRAGLDNYVAVCSNDTYSYRFTSTAESYRVSHGPLL